MWRGAQHAGREADDEIVDGLEAHPADDADDVAARRGASPSRRRASPRGRLASFVRRTTACTFLGRPSDEAERNVDDGEVRLRESGRDLREDVAPEDVDDDEVVALRGQQRKGCDGILTLVGRDDLAAHPRAPQRRSKGGQRKLFSLQLFVTRTTRGWRCAASAPVVKRGGWRQGRSMSTRARDRPLISRLDLLPDPRPLLGAWSLSEPRYVFRAPPKYRRRPRSSRRVAIEEEGGEVVPLPRRSGGVAGAGRSVCAKPRKERSG